MFGDGLRGAGGRESVNEKCPQNFVTSPIPAERYEDQKPQDLQDSTSG